ncbi:MAG: phosphate signaling complex protein PhoU [Butyrivibrio sp.]
MREYFLQQLKLLNDEIIMLGSAIEKAIGMAVEALIKKDPEKAKEVIAYDSTINQKQKTIETLCMRLLLMQQPVASDLRFISTALKMVTDMERIGDHASDISEIIILLADTDYEKNLETIKQMAVETIFMVNKSVESFVEKDTEKARMVIEYDDVVDKLFYREKEDIISLIAANPKDGDQETDLLMIAKYFERIGDHATNIAEWSIYAATGDINVIQ